VPPAAHALTECSSTINFRLLLCPQSLPHICLKAVAQQALWKCSTYILLWCVIDRLCHTLLSPAHSKHKSLLGQTQPSAGSFATLTAGNSLINLGFLLAQREGAHIGVSRNIQHSNDSACMRKTGAVHTSTGTTHHSCKSRMHPYTSMRLPHSCMTGPAHTGVLQAAI
jgi:hypothetical protein